MPPAAASMLPDANAAISSGEVQISCGTTLRFACSKYPLSIAIITGAASSAG
jgi:hypothetical protein